MKTLVQNLLKKINYIEAEIEIQKQILFSIPSDNKQDMEEIVEKIALAKDEIIKLRKEIAIISPEEYRKILKIEEASTAFRSIAAEKKFTAVESMTTEQKCSIHLKDGTELPCLVKANDEAGDWTVITLEGELCHFNCDEVE